MFCRNCGSELSDLIKVCPNCGTSVEQETAPEVPARESVDAPDVSAAPAGKSAGKKLLGMPRKLAVAVIALVAVAAIAAAAVFVLPEVVPGLQSPEKRLEKVTENLTQDLGDAMSEALDALPGSSADQQKPGSSADFMEAEPLHGTLSGTVKLKVADLLAASLGISQMQADYRLVAAEDGTAAVELSLQANGTHIADGAIYLDAAQERVILELPEMMEKPVYFSLNELVAQEPALPEMGAIAGSSSAMLASSMNMDFLQDADFLAELIPQTIRAAVDGLKDVRKSSKTFEAGGVSQKETCLTIAITQENASGAAVAALKTLASSKELYGLLRDFYDQNGAALGMELEGVEDGDDFAAYLMGQLEEAALQAGKTDPEMAGQSLGEINLWVTGKNEVKAGEIILADEMRFFVGKAQDGSRVGWEFRMENQGEYMIFALSGEEKNGKFSGDLSMDFDMDGEKLSMVLLTVTDMEENGNGTYSMDLSPFMEENPFLAGAPVESGSLVLSLTVSGKEDQRAFALDVKMLGMTMATLTVDGQVTDTAAVELPTNAIPIEGSPQPNTAVILQRLEAAGLNMELFAQSSAAAGSAR